MGSFVRSPESRRSDSAIGCFRLGIKAWKPETLSHAVTLRCGAEIPGHIGHRERLHQPVDGAGADLKLSGEGIGIPFPGAHDAAQHAQQSAQPLALADPSFSVGELRGGSRTTFRPSIPHANEHTTFVADGSLRLNSVWVVPEFFKGSLLMGFPSDPQLAVRSVSLLVTQKEGLT